MLLTCKEIMKPNAASAIKYPSNVTKIKPLKTHAASIACPTIVHGLCINDQPGIKRLIRKSRKGMDSGSARASKCNARQHA